MKVDHKELRKQLRYVVREILAEVLTYELVGAIEKKLAARMDAALDKINERQKDISAYVVRNSAKGGVGLNTEGEGK